MCCSPEKSCHLLQLEISIQIVKFSEKPSKTEEAQRVKVKMSLHAKVYKYICSHNINQGKGEGHLKVKDKSV